MEFQFRVNEGYANNDVGGLCVSLDKLNRAPVANANGPYLTAVDTAVSLDGSGSSDPDSDPLTYSWDFDEDGQFDDATGLAPEFSSNVTGVFTVGLEVCDNFTIPECDTDETTVVVYDPSAGFVTGGGWFYSQAGNYALDTQAAGKATFGFVSKYKKGASVPTGNTEFQFKAGDLNFHSTSYQWLVVTGSNTAKFKGEGTINGEGTYKFQIWAGDDPDTFRIMIWYEDGGEVVVYDNGMNQPIGAGSIVIHTKK